MISVIVTDYKNLELTKRCLESLYQTTYKSKQIIVICNGSDITSRSFYFEEQRQGRIFFVDNHYNKGLAGAFNSGVFYSKGDYLFFLNNDTLVKEDIFERLLESKSDITGCRMFNYDGSTELDSWISVDKFGCPAGKTGPIFYPDGAIFMRREVFDDIGGFDEKLFLYGEDRDLCWRAWLANYNVGVKFDAIFYHNSSCAKNGTNYYRRKISERNIIRSMIKNYSLWYLPGILIQYSFWSILELILILFTNPKALWKSYLPAYWWNIVNFKDTLSKRKDIVRRVPDYCVPFSRVIGKLFVLKTQGRPQWV